MFLLASSGLLGSPGVFLGPLGRSSGLWAPLTKRSLGNMLLFVSGASWGLLAQLAAFGAPQRPPSPWRRLCGTLAVKMRLLASWGILGPPLACGSLWSPLGSSLLLPAVACFCLLVPGPACCCLLLLAAACCCLRPLVPTCCCLWLLAPPCSDLLLLFAVAWYPLRPPDAAAAACRCCGLRLITCACCCRVVLLPAAAYCCGLQPAAAACC